MLKALMLRKRIDLKKKDLAALREKLEGFKTRESELTQAIEEVETEEQRAELDQMITLKTLVKTLNLGVIVK